MLVISVFKANMKVLGMLTVRTRYTSTFSDLRLSQQPLTGNISLCLPVLFCESLSQEAFTAPCYIKLGSISHLKNTLKNLHTAALNV